MHFGPPSYKPARGPQALYVIESIVRQVWARSSADRVGSPIGTTVAAVANAVAESALDVDAIGDGGQSYGLWQMNVRGAGRGLPVGWRGDVAAQLDHLWPEVLRRHAAKPCPPGVLEATEWWTREVERPADPDGATAVRVGWVRSRLGPLTG